MLQFFLGIPEEWLFISFPYYIMDPQYWGEHRYTPHLMYTHISIYIMLVCVELCDLAKLLALPVRFWIPVALRTR